MPGERFGHSWEERFALTQAYGPLLGKVIQSVLEKADVAPAATARKIVLDTPNPRAADEIVRALKLDPAKFADSLRAHRRTDRRRACGPDADRRPAVG